MIQRKQTLYLLLAFICNLLLLFFPLFNVDATNFYGTTVGYELGATGIEGSGGPVFYPVFILYTVLAMMTALGIAFFKNRVRQLLICRLNLIIHILVVIGLFTVYYAGKGAALDRLKEIGYKNMEIGTDVGFYLVIAAIPFITLAIRGIRADQLLLQSIDRLR